jgi:signal peptidase I
MTLNFLLKGGGFALRFLRETIIFFLLLILTHTFVATIIVVDGTSMIPNLKDREIIVLNKLSRNLTLKRGEIVVFHYPGDPRRNYIKRVIGLPGEKVEIKDGILYINDNPLKEEYLPPEFRTETPNQTHLKVQEGSYLVLGDNRPGSNDSRYFGPVEQRFIVGTALMSIRFNGLKRLPEFHVFSLPYYPRLQKN